MLNLFQHFIYKVTIILGNQPCEVPKQVRYDVLVFTYLPHPIQNQSNQQ